MKAGYLAAVLACGEGALLSGRPAAYLLGVLKGVAPRPEVTAPTKRLIAGVVTHRARGASRPDAMTWRAIPVTTVATTLVDLAAVLNVDDLASACHEAGVRHATTPVDVEAVLARRPRAAGAAKLRRILRGDVHVTLSALERRLALLTDASMPLPRTNRPAGRRWVDCRWPELRITVELDSYREREVRARGDELRRYTYGDVFDDPRLMLAELEALLPKRPD